MPIQKTKTESFRLAGSIDEVLARCVNAMEHAGFKNIAADDVTHRVIGDRKKINSWARAELSLSPGGDGYTQVEVKSTAAVDNVWAIGGPNKRLIEALKVAIDEVDAGSSTAETGPPRSSGEQAAPPTPDTTPQISGSTATSDEIERLAELHRSGDLTDEEFSTAKARLLG